MTGGRGGGVLRIAALALGFGFLYLPIAVLVGYSFNASRLVTIWGGFSTRWYGALLVDEKFREAALTSLEIGVMAASLALVLGTCAGLAMNRFVRFRGRLLFGFMLMAPLVVPEVILGLSLLLLFVEAQSLLEWPASRGILTVTIAHATFAACFVAVLVRAQLGGFRPQPRRGRARSRRAALRRLVAYHLAGHQPGARLGLAVGLHPVARRSRRRQLCLGTLGDDLADGGLFERAHRGDPGDQCAVDAVSGRRLHAGGARLPVDDTPGAAPHRRRIKPPHTSWRARKSRHAGSISPLRSPSSW